MAKWDSPQDSGYDKLKADIKAKAPGNCYILHGEEAYLRNYELGRLKKLILDDLTSEFNFHRFTQENFSMEALLDSVESYPMMAEKSLVQVDEIDLFSLSEADRERLTTMLEDMPDYCCVVFVYETTEFKPDKRKKKLRDAISAHSTIVEFKKQSERALCEWIWRHFKAFEKEIPQNLCSYLILQTGGSMTLLEGEISKIALYSEQTNITKADIDAVVEPVLEAMVFDISDAIAGGNYTLALTKLQTLLKKQEEPVMIVGAIGSQMRRLNCAKILADHGKGPDALMKLCSIGETPARITMNQARKLSSSFCEKAVLLCLQTDEQLKTSYDDKARLTELLILRLSQEARA